MILEYDAVKIVNHSYNIFQLFILCPNISSKYLRRANQTQDQEGKKGLRVKGAGDA